MEVDAAASLLLPELLVLASLLPLALVPRRRALRSSLAAWSLLVDRMRSRMSDMSETRLIDRATFLADRMLTSSTTAAPAAQRHASSRGTKARGIIPLLMAAASAMASALACTTGAAAVAEEAATLVPRWAATEALIRLAKGAQRAMKSSAPPEWRHRSATISESGSQSRG
jgi:hypothetical protein